ncbi:alpha/beta hydrolase [Cohnella caldifontis]|uniref:alpha/beta hydrolase n=1 Tax=Cohnella caldifontis TaxID=3027471 RepID=UPI0023EC3531|nr:alpha/beta hydrolase [Cohnella sp. YIM B05605]
MSESRWMVCGMTRSEYVAKLKEKLPALPRLNKERFARKWLDIPYTNLPDSKKLDVYLPEDGNGPYPAVLYIHGGGFFLGSKDDVTSAHALHAPDRGYAAVVIDYSLSLEASFPTQIHEVKAAIRWLKANGGAYGIDPGRIALMGASAGAHLAALAGTSGAVGALEDKSLGHPGQNAKVQAVVVDFTPVDFASVNEQLVRLGRRIPEGFDAPQYSSALYLGDLMERVPEIVRAANPETYVSSDAPPFYIQHGTEHEILPYLQSVHFAELLERAIGRELVVLSLLQGVGGGEDPNYFTPETVAREFDFLDRYLK